MRFEYSSIDQLDHISSFYQHAVDHFDAFLSISAPYDLQELAGIQKDKKFYGHNII